MKAHLMYADRDFDLGAPPLANEDDLVQDLELTSLFAAMSGDDRFLYQVAQRAVLTSLADPDEIRYRQRVLTDCLEHPDLVREAYAIAVEAVVKEKKIYQPVFAYASGILRRSTEVLEMFVDLLRRLRKIADDHAEQFASDGFTTFFKMLKTELDDAYFHEIDDQLKRLHFKDGVLMSAQLGQANKGTHYVLRTPTGGRRRFKEVIGVGPRTEYSFRIAPRDEAGAKALSELSDRGINLAANALAQSADHVRDFFTMLCRELGFYVGCINLREALAGKGEPICTPEVAPSERRELAFAGLCDVCLTLGIEERVVGNDVNADGKSLVMITGANSGGKSTLLRSIGIAQLMMQSGMFVCAERFRANVCDGVFTHFIREEDPSMTSGKFDEEMARMSVLADEMTPHSLALFNESFAATNEREGSEIARQIIRALREAGVKVVFVTHMYDLAASFYAEHEDHGLFMRAERQADGRRSFKLVEGEPLPTSYGEDLFERIGGFSKRLEVPSGPSSVIPGSA